MGGCEYRMRRLSQVRGIVLIISLLAAIYLNLILGTALAGTENGEFCPTCPDWTDLDGWLAKKDAYEKAQMNEMLQKGQANSSHASGSYQGSTSSLSPKSPANGYPESKLFTTADAAYSWTGMAILDTRSPQEYQSGHVPGARNLYWKDLQKGGSLDPDLAESALCKAGVNNSDRIVIYGGSDEGAAFVFWALNYLGHKDMSLLNGGIDAAWSAGIKPGKSIPSVSPSNYAIHIVPWLLVTPKTLESFLGLSDIQILDARDFADYGMNRLTSSSIPLTADNLYDDSKIKDAATLKELLERRSLNEKGTQIVYGTPQAYWLFYSLKLMGYNATLLEGDWWKQTKWAASNIH
jgi:thiosulfate/3-mercaptopyruvate sulfurtransferase